MIYSFTKITELQELKKDTIQLAEAIRRYKKEYNNDIQIDILENRALDLIDIFIEMKESK